MQPDGNSVVYRGDGRPVWASGTNGNGESSAIIQSDSNFVVYTVANYRPTWSMWAGGRL